MSIINDALRKTQSDMGEQNPLLKPRNDKERWLPVITTLIFIAIVAVIFAAVYLIYSSRSARVPQITRTVPAEPAAARIIANKVPSPAASTPVDGTLTLTGIIASPDGNLALINNKIFRAGDYVEEGSRIVKISEDQVEILNNGKVVTLTIQK